MQLTTLIFAALVACSGFAAAAPNAIPSTDIVLPPVLNDYKGISSGAGQNNGDFDDADDDSYLKKRGNWVRHVKFCEDANGKGACNVKDFKPSTGCYNLWGWFNDKISSIYLAPGTKCTVYRDGNCRGSWLVIFDPGYKNLKGQSSLNDQISSLRCEPR